MSHIDRACQEWGFFQLMRSSELNLVNHGIPESLLDGVKEVCSYHYKQRREGSFKKSQPVKELENAISGKGGAQRVETLDWEDAFMLYYTEYGDQWRSDPLNFKKTMLEFSSRVKDLANTILEILDENLGLEKGYLYRSFRGSEDEPFFATKISHYPPWPRPDLVYGLRAHTDAGGVILLFQDDQVDGLQVLKDDQWFDVKPTPNANIVVDIGDQLEVMSNGKYVSAWHRVLATKELGNRRSVAPFCNPMPSAIISPATSLLRGDDLMDYPSFSSADYMLLYAKQKFHPKESRIQAMKY